MREDGYFYYRICDFGHFYEVKKNRGISKIFFRPLFIIIFRSKIVILDTDSILRVNMIYELVIGQVRCVKGSK